jgi:tRNA(fMet)-specific endonuclease VapC
MSSRLAVDTNAVVDYLRSARIAPVILDDPSLKIVVPLVTLGELYAGIYKARRQEENLAALESLLLTWTVLLPDEETAVVYGRLRAEDDRRTGSEPKPNRMNDIWIAALCIQHDLTLLTNDAGLRRISALRCVSW